MISKRRMTLRLASAALLAASSMGTLALVANTGTVHADPAWEAGAFGLRSTRTGVGSDTIQNIYDYFSGADTYPNASSGTALAPTLTTPVHTGTSTGDVIVQSFDAFAPPSGTSAHPGCIVTTVNGPTFDRPNGSGAGINALNDANSGTGWQASAATTCTGKTVGITGDVDFARSSRGPTSAGSNDTWIPFGRDAIAYVFVDGNSNTLGALTSTQVNQIYTGGTDSITVSGHKVIGCYPQPNSGTRLASEVTYGLTDAQVTAAIALTGCGVVVGGGTPIAGSGLVEENNGNALLNEVNALITAGSQPAGTWAVEPFSAGVWLAQANGGAPDFSNNLRTAESTGTLDGLGAPDSQAPLGGSGPSPAGSNNGAYTINNTYYRTTNAVVSGLPFGRYLYTVVPTVNITPDIITGVAPDPALTELFVGGTSSLCTQGATAAILNRFGYDQLVAPELLCGDTSTTGNV